MSNSKLPEPEELALLVSNVTKTMCGATFVLDDPLERGLSVCDQMVMIPMLGDPPITVVVSSDGRGSRALGAAFFGCEPQAITPQMVDDVIAELLNMVAGQIAGALAFQHSLGLPRRTNLAEIAEQGNGFDDAILLRSEGKVDLRLWILEDRSRKAAVAERSRFKGRRG
jgi:hypothetical protein